MLMDKQFGTQQSSTKNNDTSPEYQETFWFEVPSLKNLVLKCKVMDKDPLRDDKLGFCKFKLDDMGLTSSPQAVDKVIDNNIFVKDGKIHLKLSYED